MIGPYFYPDQLSGKIQFEFLNVLWIEYMFQDGGTPPNSIRE